MKVLLKAGILAITGNVRSTATVSAHKLTTTLRGNAAADHNDAIPEFFPADMKKEDLELYFSKRNSGGSTNKEEPSLLQPQPTKDDWLQQCASMFVEYFDGAFFMKRSNFYLIDVPSGLCTDGFVCAFDDCTLGDPATLECLFNQTDLVTSTFDEITARCGDFPPFALPESVKFPKNAFDVVRFIRLARRNSKQISVKSTGHSYTGASTKAGTLMINMRDYVKYAAGDNAVVECGDRNAMSNDVPAAPVDGDACALATARGKDAYIKVGGGQTWSDVYNAIIASNKSGNLSRKYGVGGGAAGSVGAAGGWLAGGGLSTGYERTEGLGVDQILELELALPNGKHVRIFPSKWDHVEGFIYPQTSEVTALCNANVATDESQWNWRRCNRGDLSVSPEDLWFAFRGGGGGTFGIVLSVKYQLFEQLSFEVIQGGLGTLALLSGINQEAKDVYDKILLKLLADEELADVVRRTYTLFLVDFLFAPDKISVGNDASLPCGDPALNYQFDQVATLSCWGKDSSWPELLSSWERTVSGADFASKDPELASLLARYAFHKVEPSDYGLDLDAFSSYPELARDFGVLIDPAYNDIYPPNVIPDSPLPTVLAGKGYNSACSLNIPMSLLQSEDESERDLIFRMFNTTGAEHVTGGNVAVAGDGMDAVSPSERISGQSSMGISDANLFKEYSAAVHKHRDVQGGYPGIYEYNHICPGATTMSKSDWTKTCDGEGGEECFSIQESVWGEELHSKLQGIKSAIDPDNMFDCYPCVNKPN